MLSAVKIVVLFAYGEEGCSEEIPLDASTSSDDTPTLFEPNATDEFKVGGGQCRSSDPINTSSRSVE